MLMISVTVYNFTAKSLRATISGLKFQKTTKKRAKIAFRYGPKLFKMGEIREITSFLSSLKLKKKNSVNRAIIYFIP